MADRSRTERNLLASIRKAKATANPAPETDSPAKEAPKNPPLAPAAEKPPETASRAKPTRSAKAKTEKKRSPAGQNQGYQSVPRVWPD